MTAPCSSRKERFFTHGSKTQKDPKEQRNGRRKSTVPNSSGNFTTFVCRACVNELTSWVMRDCCDCRLPRTNHKRTPQIPQKALSNVILTQGIIFFRLIFETRRSCSRFGWLRADKRTKIYWQSSSVILFSHLQTIVGLKLGEILGNIF
jgi:hypothetical protein